MFLAQISLMHLWCTGNGACFVPFCSQRVGRLAATCSGRKRNTFGVRSQHVPLKGGICIAEKLWIHRWKVVFVTKKNDNNGQGNPKRSASKGA